MNLIDRFLFIEPEGKRSLLEVIGWWELRRLPFNCVIILVGILSISIRGWFSPGLSEDDQILPLSTFLFLALCNFCYTFGWITELFTDREHSYAPKTFKLGLLLTLSLIILPALAAVIGAFVRLVS